MLVWCLRIGLFGDFGGKQQKSAGFYPRSGDLRLFFCEPVHLAATWGVSSRPSIMFSPSRCTEDHRGFSLPIFSLTFSVSIAIFRPFSPNVSAERCFYLRS